MTLINEVRTWHLSVPLKRKLYNSIYCIDRIEHVLVEIDAGGFTGIGFVYCVDHSHGRALKQLVDGFAQDIKGAETDMTGKHWDIACKRIKGVGCTGLPLIAWAAFDIALWDIMAKKAGLPLYKMLGAYTDTVEVYASGGWLIPLEELVEEACGYKEQGFRRYKMKVGSRDLREDIKRIEKVKTALGDTIEIMLDANEGWNLKKAMQAAPYLLDMGIKYLEEPLDARDYENQSCLRNNTALDIAAGESLFAVSEINELIKNRCADIINPDLQRCGGITGYIKVIALAHAAGIPLTSHVFTEASIHLVAASPTALHAEYVPEWWSGLFTPTLDVKDGFVKLGDRPGLGIDFDHSFISSHQ